LVKQTLIPAYSSLTPILNIAFYAFVRAKAPCQNCFLCSNVYRVPKTLCGFVW